MCTIDIKYFRKLFIKEFCHLYGTFIAKEEMLGFEDWESHHWPGKKN